MKKLQAGILGRACAVDKLPVQLTQVCFRDVKPGDILRVEGRAWRANPAIEEWDTKKTAEFFSTFQPPPISCGATLPNTCPPNTPAQQAFIKQSIEFGKAKFSYARPSTGWINPGEVRFSARVGNGASIDPADLQDSGRITVETYPTGWFAFNFLMPSTFGNESASVCFQEQPVAQTLTYGRSLNMTPSSLNDDCPASGCVPPHRWLLDWKAVNPRQEKKVYESRMYQMMTRQLKGVISDGGL